MWPALKVQNLCYLSTVLRSDWRVTTVISSWLFLKFKGVPFNKVPPKKIVLWYPLQNWTDFKYDYGRDLVHKTQYGPNTVSCSSNVGLLTQSLISSRNCRKCSWWTFIKLLKAIVVSTILYLILLVSFLYCGVCSLKLSFLFVSS